MGKRGDSAPAPVSARVQALVDHAKQHFGKAKGAPVPNARPQATPARAVTPPPKPSQIATPPAPTLKQHSPMSTSSTPLKSPDAKRYRSASSLSSTPSEASQIFCGVPCLVKSTEKPAEAESAKPTAEPEKPNAEPIRSVTATAEPIDSVKATAEPEKPDAEVPATMQEPDPEAMARESEPKMMKVAEQKPVAPESSAPTSVCAKACATAMGVSVSAEASGADVTMKVAATSADAKVEATVHQAPARKPDGPDDLEKHLEQLLEEQEMMEQANDRASEAESRAKALQMLLQTLLEKPAEVQQSRSGELQCLLRRGSTEDIEKATAAMTETENKNSPAGVIVQGQVKLVWKVLVWRLQRHPCGDAQGVSKESGTRVETPKESGTRVETPKESGTHVETAKESAGTRETAKESAGTHVETAKEPGTRPETPNQTQVKQEPKVKQEPDTEDSAPPAKPKTKKNRENETEEDRRVREAHNSYMRYFRSIRSSRCPPEVRERCLTSAGKKKSPAIMRQMYEMFLTCDGDWLSSSLVVNARKKKGSRRRGRYLWKKFEHGEAIAEDIVASKKAMDQTGRGIWWKVHPDQPKNKEWELFKCFDSREELTESEDEMEFGLNADVEMDHQGTTGILSHLLDRGSDARGSNDPPGDGPPPPPPNRERRVPKAKEASQEAMDLLKKGPQRFIEADGMESMLHRGGMHLGLCRIDKF
ncbi:unnamed protein product [Symbiodinium sp. CCMP2592]|nr:unnamed protein product [Symbiodinium sp. CCMP2592]